MVDLRWLTCADFAARVGETFVVEAGAGAGTELVLAEATEGTEAGGRGPEGQERRQFSLLFRGPAGEVMPQGTQHLEHPDLGALDLFLVPVSSDADGVRYEAAFA